jgi:ferredoxin
VKLTVDAERCMGHGRCYTVAPDLLTYDEEGFVSIRGQVIDVPDGDGGGAELPGAGPAPDPRRVGRIDSAHIDRAQVRAGSIREAG